MSQFGPGSIISRHPLNVRFHSKGEHWWRFMSARPISVAAALTTRDTTAGIDVAMLEHDPEKAALDLIRGGPRFSEKHTLELDPGDHAPANAPGQPMAFGGLQASRP
jgi:hypothetical protein